MREERRRWRGGKGEKDGNRDIERERRTCIWLQLWFLIIEFYHKKTSNVKMLMINY